MRPDCLNNYCPVALTSVVICSSIPSTLNPLQFAQSSRQINRRHYSITSSTLTQSHLDKKGSYMRLLFIDYSSVFNTIVPSRLVTKLKDLIVHVDLSDGETRW